MARPWQRTRRCHHQGLVKATFGKPRLTLVVLSFVVLAILLQTRPSFSPWFDNYNSLLYSTVTETPLLLPQSDPLQEAHATKVLERLIATAQNRAAHIDSVYRSYFNATNPPPKRHGEPPEQLPWVDAHPLLIDIHKAYRPPPHWKDEKFPNINIIGLPKAGTSNLYSLLTNHPELSPYHKPYKEYCARVLPLAGVAGVDVDPFDSSYFMRPDQHRDTQVERIQHDLHAHYKHKNPDRNRRTVNGCLFWAEVLLQYHYIQPSKANTKIILLFRDPADLLWASWNFWLDESTDAQPVEKGTPKWANDELHYRSPELFHEYMQAGNRIAATKALLYRRNVSILAGRIWQALMGKEGVLFVRKEDMEPDVIEKPGGFLDQVSDFLQIDRTSFPRESTQAFTNCNADKGEKQACTNASNAYAITGGRPMLEKTRELIYLQFAEECHIWAEEFGVVYPECLQVRERLVVGS